EYKDHLEITEYLSVHRQFDHRPHGFSSEQFPAALPNFTTTTTAAAIERLELNLGSISFSPCFFIVCGSLYALDGQIPPPFGFYNPPNLQDQSQHPPYIPPPFHVVGFAPVPGPANNGGGDEGIDLQWNYGLEPKRKRLKEQDFLENNSHISSIDFLQVRSVSTGLGLSLDNNRPSSSTGSALMALVGDDIHRELQRQDEEINRFLKVQGNRLRQNVLEKIQTHQVQTISLLEDKIVQKLHKKEAEMERINEKNLELEDRMEQISAEAGVWQQRARFNENLISALKSNLQQVYAQSRESKEGCGDSKVDDTASCCNGPWNDFQKLPKEKKEMKELMTCKVCRVKKVCMLLLPCKHLCLCKDCESKLSFCPLCQSSKFLGMEVYM
ncbi:Probable BOI-related E3 ubiquitin-protein ligase 3, partial [Linum perenne]